MNKLTRLDKLIYSLIYIVICLIISSYVQFLFPYSELAGLINFPLSLILGIFLTIIIHFIGRYHAFTVPFSLIIYILLLLYFLPQSRGPIYKQLSKYLLAYQNYENIRCKEIDFDDFVMKIIYKKKFLNGGYQKLYNIRYSCFESEEFREIIFDSLLIFNKEDENNNYQSLLELNFGENKIFKIRKNEILQGGGLAIDSTCYLDFYEINLKIDEGFEEVFYGLLPNMPNNSNERIKVDLKIYSKNYDKIMF